MKPGNSISGIIFLFIFAIPFDSLFAQGNRQKLFSIGKDEVIVYGESQISIDNSEYQVSLVTVDFNGKYYLYDITGEKGPFDDFQSTGYKPAEDDSYMVSSIYSFDGDGFGQDLVSYDDQGQTLIKSGGKTYGPFASVMDVFTDKSGKLTMALTGEGMNFSMLTADGKIIPLEGTPNGTSVSSTLDKVMLNVVKEENPALDYMNMDLSKMSQEELLKIAKDIEEKQKNAPPPEAYIYLNDGEKFGPYPKEIVYGGNPFFCKTGGDNWVLLDGKKLYVNGNLLDEVQVDYVSPGDIWISADGKRYAIISMEKILFSDGQSFANPLKVKMQDKDGKTWLSWVCLENDVDIVLYSKAL